MTADDLRTQIEKLNRIGIALSSETKIDRLLDLILHEAQGFAGADAGSLYINKDDCLHFAVAQNDTLEDRDGDDEISFRPFPLPLTKDSIAGFVALTGEILNIEDAYTLEDDDSVPFGFNREFDLRNRYRTRSMLVVPMLTHQGENIGVLQLINALDANRQVIPFPKDVEPLVRSLASQAAVAIINAQLIASIKNLFAALVQYSASAIDARSPHTAGHSRRVAGLSLALANAMNRQTGGPYAGIQFTNEQIEELSYAAWLHDVGKIGVKEQVLEKANKLSDTRMELIRSRFDRIGLALKLACQKRLLELHGSDGDVTEEVAALEEERERQLAQLDRDLALVVKINAPGWVSDEELVRLEEIAALRYTDRDGNSNPYLTEFELKNLSVRKGNLTLEEYREIQSHVLHTRNILAKIPFTPELAQIPVFAAAHHEMLNGTGYPQGLVGEDIPLQARIIGVADIFDALVAKDRPYKKAMPIDKALNILREEAETGRLDSGLVDLFIKKEIWTRPVVDSLIVKDEYSESQETEC